MEDGYRYPVNRNNNGRNLVPPDAQCVLPAAVELLRHVASLLVLAVLAAPCVLGLVLDHAQVAEDGSRLCQLLSVKAQSLSVGLADRGFHHVAAAVPAVRGLLDLDVEADDLRAVLLLLEEYGGVVFDREEDSFLPAMDDRLVNQRREGY